MILHHYLEAIHKDKKNDFVNLILKETSRFFNEFLSGYMTLHKDDIHKILHYYTQIAVQNSAPCTDLILALIVFFNKE